MHVDLSSTCVAYMIFVPSYKDYAPRYRHMSTAPDFPHRRGRRIAAGLEAGCSSRVPFSLSCLLQTHCAPTSLGRQGRNAFCCKGDLVTRVDDTSSHFPRLLFSCESGDDLEGEVEGIARGLSRDDVPALDDGSLGDLSTL